MKKKERNMAETLASRVGRLISGTANSLVDAIENAAPEIVMEQALREIDQAIDDVRAELGHDRRPQSHGDTPAGG